MDNARVMVGVLNPRVLAALQKMLPYPSLPMMVQVSEGRAQLVLHGQGWRFRASIPAEGVLEPMYLPAGVFLTLLQHASGSVWSLQAPTGAMLVIRTPDGSEYRVRHAHKALHDIPGIPASPRRSLENLLRVLRSLGSVSESAGTHEGWRRVSVGYYELEHAS